MLQSTACSKIHGATTLVAFSRQAVLLLVIPSGQNGASMFRFGAKWVVVVGIVVATSAVLGAAANNGNGGNPKQPDVVAATVSVDQSTLFVYGENLSSFIARGR
jgi:hypothetical protein